MIQYGFVEKKSFIVGSLFCLSCIFVIPSFFSIGDGDAGIHMPWVSAYAQALWQGDVFPGWLSRLNAGCGSPDMIFYTTLPYAVSSIFYPLDFGASGWNAMMLTMLLAVFIGSYGMYRFLVELTHHPVASLLSTALFMLSPIWTVLFYKNFLFTFVISGFIGTWLLYYALMLARYGKRHTMFQFALVLAILINTNISGTLLFGAMALAVLLIELYIQKALGVHRLKKFVAATVMGILLAAFYLLPVAELLDSTVVNERVYGEAVSYGNNFLGLPLEGDDKGKMQWARTVMSVVAYAYIIFVIIMSVKIRHLNESRWKFWVAIMLFSIFCTHSASIVVWDHLPLLSVVQFPIRLMAVVTIAFVVTVSYYLVRDHEIKPVNDVVPSFGILFFMFVLAPMSLIMDYVLSAKYVDEEFRKNAITHYIPMQNFFIDSSGSALNQYIQDEKIDEVIDMCRKPVTVVQGEATVQLVHQDNKDVMLHVQSHSEQSVIGFNQLSHPWWYVELDGREVPKGQWGAFNQVSVEVPHGEHEVRLVNKPSTIQWMGYGISLLMLCFIMWGIRQKDE